MGLSEKFAFVKTITPLQILLAVFPFITGIFYEWQSALVTIALLTVLLLEIVKRKAAVTPVKVKNKSKRNKQKADEFEINIGLPLIFAVSIVVFHALSSFWAVDRGMVWLGVIKYLPLPVFVLAASREEEPLKFIPHSGALMTVVSVALSGINALRGHIIVSGRIGGFFEYPNVFAMFLLVCLILVLFKENIKIIDWVFAAIYLAGIALSGSRTVMILTVLTAIVFIVWVKDKKIKFIALGAFIVVAAAAGIYLSQKLSSLTNFSTFYGRFLYFADALPVIVKHPFGLGYYGYSYTLGSFQTGVYSLVHIHNDLLQILLDIGWVPAVLGIVMTAKAFIKADFRSKVMLSMLILHLIFDFDMQFISMTIIFMAIVLKSSSSRKVTLKRRTALVSASAMTVVFAGVSIWLGLASFLHYIHKYDAAVKTYPMYTESQKVLLINAQIDTEMNSIADSILSHNPDCSLANNAKARVCFASGDIIGMIDYKDKAIQYNRYSLDEYLDYIQMLQYSISLYAQNNDYSSAEYCVDKCISVANDLKRVEAGTSRLGYMIDDKPELELPAEYSEYIKALEEIKYS